MSSKYVKYVIEIDRNGNLIDWPFCQNNFNLVSVMYQNQPVIEIGLNGVKPNGGIHYTILDKKQYTQIGKFLLLFLHSLTAIRTEKETVFINVKNKLKSFPSRRFSVSKQNEFILSDIMFLECFNNQKYLKRINKIVSSVFKLNKLKTDKVILEKLQLILKPEYPCSIKLIPFHILLIHLLDNRSISKFYNHIQYTIFNIFQYSTKEYEKKKALIESSTRPREDIQLRIIKENDDYVVFEIFNQ